MFISFNICWRYTISALFLSTSCSIRYAISHKRDISTYRDSSSEALLLACTFSTKPESFSGSSLMTVTGNTFDNIYQTLSFTHEVMHKIYSKFRATITSILISNFSSQHVRPSRFKPRSILHWMDWSTDTITLIQCIPCIRFTLIFIQSNI